MVARGGRSKIQSNHVERNIGAPGRKSILLHCNKWHECLIFPAGNRSELATREPLSIILVPGWECSPWAHLSTLEQPTPRRALDE
jgi:hypothetical protein